jgi:non-heme chloroperoxidase
VIPQEDRFADLSDGLRICYRTYGAPERETILLIAGLGLQLISWPQDFISALVGEGYQVIAPDNRDAGRSSKLKTRPPGKLDLFLRRAPAENYDLNDMADDMSRLLTSLRVPAAHVVGMSMGGMIGQNFAARHPEQVRSLVSIFSTTGAKNVGQPAFSTVWRMGRPAPRSSAEAVERFVGMMRHIGDPTVPGIEAAWSDYAARGWERSGNRANASGLLRQIAAVHKSGDRTAQLQRIRARTLVLHGDKDLMVHPSGGRATLQCIEGARMVTIAGMRHQIDHQRAPELATHILSHIRGTYEEP